MNSGALTYEETLPAHAEGLPAYGDALPVNEVADGLPGSLDRGTDWPLVFAFFAPLVVAYGAIAYGLYLAAAAIF